MIILHGDSETYPVNHRGPILELSLTPELDAQVGSKEVYVDGSLNRKVSKLERRVRFSDDVTVHDLPHYSTFTPSELRCCWNTAEDMFRIHFSNRMLVAQAMKGEMLDEDQDSLRGLEHQLRGNESSRRHQESVVVVLETQEEFWDEADGVEELCETMFLLYGTISQESAAEAALIGQNDAREAKRVSRCVCCDLPFLEE